MRIEDDNNDVGRLFNQKLSFPMWAQRWLRGLHEGIPKQLLSNFSIVSFQNNYHQIFQLLVHHNCCKVHAVTIQQRNWPNIPCIGLKWIEDWDWGYGTLLKDCSIIFSVIISLDFNRVKRVLDPGIRRTFFFVAMKTPSMRCSMLMKQTHLGYQQYRQTTTKSMLFYQSYPVSLSLICLF